MPPPYDLQFTPDPAQFLTLAGDHLAANPLLATVVVTMADRLRVDPDCPRTPDGVGYWWLVVRDERGEVVGAGMRTRPRYPYAPYLLPLPPGAGEQVAHALRDRGEEVVGVNGALPAVAEFAEAYADGAPVRVDTHTRLFELADLVPPRAVPGRLRVADETDAELAATWLADFARAAAEQAGRPVQGPEFAADRDQDDALRRIRSGRLWFWVDDEERPVHLTGANPPSLGVARIGPVYTPRAHRRHGYAAAAVAAVSELFAARGVRVCLFTDQANPTSNKIYTELGYRPVVDMANLKIGERHAMLVESAER